MARGQLEDSAREEERGGRGQWSPAATFLAAARASSGHSGGGEGRGRCWRAGDAGGSGSARSAPRRSDAGAKNHNTHERIRTIYSLLYCR